VQERGYRGEGREMYIVMMKKEGLFYKSSDPFTFPHGDWNHIILFFFFWSEMKTYIRSSISPLD
jgi:hypothetical protein